MTTHETITFRQRDVEGPELLHTLKSIVPNSRSGTMAVSATVLTLVLFVDHRDASNWQHLAQRLATVHPARVLVIHPEGSGEGAARLDADMGVTLRHRPGQSPLLFSELVELTMKGALATHWIDLIQPLILSDVPSYLWWLTAPPLPDFRWDLLKDAVDHLVIDHRQYSLQAWQRSLWRALSEGIAVDDLAWFEQTAWREALADAADLEELRSIIVEPHAITTVWPTERRDDLLLLMGWLCDRLHWTLHPQGALQPPRGRPIPWQATVGGAPQLVLTRAQQSVTVSQEQDFVVLHHGSSRRVAGLRHREPEAGLLTLFTRGHDAVFPNALSWALRANTSSIIH